MITEQTILELLELKKMTPEKSSEVLERLAKLVFQAVLARVLPTLKETDLKEYEEIFEKKEDIEILFKFLNEKIPDFKNIIKEEGEILTKKLQEEFKPI